VAIDIQGAFVENNALLQPNNIRSANKSGTFRTKILLIAKYISTFLENSKT
jgi:hypothetical protein